MLRYEQHMRTQPRSPAAALCAAAGDTTRASATPLAHEAGDEEAALQPKVDSLARGKSVCPKPKQFVLGGRGALGLIPDASWGAVRRQLRGRCNANANPACRLKYAIKTN